MAGLSFTQVSTWFINARKRVWKPLIHENADHDELTGAAALRSTPDSGPESEPGANSDSDASSDSELERSARDTVKHDWQVKASHSTDWAHCASEDVHVQDAEMQDATQDLAGCVAPLMHHAAPPAGKLGRSHVEVASTTTSPEHLLASHVISPYHLMMKSGSVNQYADVVLGRHPQPHEEKQVAETYDHCQGLALFPNSFPTASPCSSPRRDSPFYAAANQFPHTLPPFGTHVGTQHHSIATVCTTFTGTCWPGSDILDFMC